MKYLPNDIEVFIPATRSHLMSVDRSIERLLSQGVDKHSIVIVTPRVDDFSAIGEKYSIRVKSDGESTVVDLRDISDALPVGMTSVAGWYFQQFLKYELVRTSEGMNVLVIDADTIVLQDVHKLMNSFGLSKERHAPYYRHYELLMGSQPAIPQSAIVNFMWFKPIVLREMLAFIEDAHGGPWWKSILNLIAHEKPGRLAFSEYETYANWCIEKGHQKNFVDFPVFRRADLLLPPFSAISRLEAKGYGAVAFEHGHAKSWLKATAVNFIYLLSLKYW